MRPHTQPPPRVSTLALTVAAAILIVLLAAVAFGLYWLARQGYLWLFLIMLPLYGALSMELHAIWRPWRQRWPTWTHGPWTR